MKTANRNLRQPTSEVVRQRIIADFVRVIYQPIALTPRRIAKRLGFYESSTRVDLATLERAGVIKSFLPRKAGEKGRHDRLYWGGS